MKKILSFLSALALCCALSACGGQGAGTGASQAPATPQPTQTPVSTQPLETPEPSASADVPALSAPVDETANENHILIACFAYGENAPLADGVDASTSASIQYRDGKLTGNTGLVAGMIADATGGDLFSILTVEQYPDSYDDTIDVGQEEKRANARPELSSHIEDLNRYDTIFLGFPNWWGDITASWTNTISAAGPSSPLSPPGAAVSPTPSAPLKMPSRTPRYWRASPCATTAPPRRRTTSPNGCPGLGWPDNIASLPSDHF